jgi:hypothetical protein
MTAEKIAEVFGPLAVLRRKALLEANRTGQPVEVQIPGGTMTVKPS